MFRHKLSCLFVAMGIYFYSHVLEPSIAPLVYLVQPKHRHYVRNMINMILRLNVLSIDE